MSGIRANAPIPGATSKPTRRFDSNREDGYYQFDDDFHGTRVRVRTVDHSYEGWARLWHFDQHAILLYDATRDDGEELGLVTINEPETVARLDLRGLIWEFPVEAIRLSPYDARSHDDVDHQQFARQTREHGQLLTFPSVRPLSNGEYETVGSSQSS